MLASAAGLCAMHARIRFIHLPIRLIFLKAVRLDFFPTAKPAWTVEPSHTVATPDCPHARPFFVLGAVLP